MTKERFIAKAIKVMREYPNTFAGCNERKMAERFYDWYQENKKPLTLEDMEKLLKQ